MPLLPGLPDPTHPGDPCALFNIPTRIIEGVGVSLDPAETPESHSRFSAMVAEMAMGRDACWSSLG